MSEAEQKAEQFWGLLIGETTHPTWLELKFQFVTTIAAALREAWQAGHDAADGEPYTDREKLIAERDVEFVRGLRRAQEIAYNVWHERDYFDDLIQAEIDKAKAGKP